MRDFIFTKEQEWWLKTLETTTKKQETVGVAGDAIDCINCSVTLWLGVSIPYPANPREGDDPYDVSLRRNFSVGVLWE